MNTRIHAMQQPMHLSVPRLWRDLTLAKKFAILALALSFVSTLTLGNWVSTKIEQTAVAREAGAAANYIGHFVSPAVQEIGTRGRLSPARLDELDVILNSAAVRLRVVAMKVWGLDGRILYSSDRASIGDIFPIDDTLERALEGSIAAEFNEPGHESAAENEPGHESAAEYADRGILLEVYAPVHAESTGKVIAVAEFYEQADDLFLHLRNAKIQGWMVTGFVLVSIFVGFSTLVGDGSRTIELQRDELTRHITSLSRAIANNSELRERIERGARNVIEENERFLSGIGSDLHDGPAQLISLGLLRLDAIEAAEADPDRAAVRAALTEAMAEIRSISAGLLLPNFENIGLSECLAITIKSHEDKTGKPVTASFDNLPATCPPYIKICLCRFIQEGLSNAFRHAGRADHHVLVVADHAGIRAEVRDNGPGIAPGQASDFSGRLGLIGLRGRLESIRGTFTVTSSAAAGTTLTAWLPLGAS
ncbi:ATP-binding protein [Mesorhizobium sp. CAU 1732]|uniref:sensor histidine kinase n=1 Tax=Mesorhizobium sp. CAU 1732 TaxID=3140358 RepID=UPI0032607420